MKNSLLDKYLNKKSKKKISNFFSKILICLIIILSSLIYVSNNSQNKDYFRKLLFEKNFNFASFKKWYQKIGSSKSTKENAQVVFNESDSFANAKRNGNGYDILVNDNHIVNSFSGGIVVFVGTKEGFNKTVIVQGSDGYDIWYANLDNINIKIYDYISSGDIIGSANEKYTYLITKDNKYYSYDEYKTQV